MSGTDRNNRRNLALFKDVTRWQKLYCIQVTQITVMSVFIIAAVLVIA